MMTTIILIIIAACVIGLGIWSWWFENGKTNANEDAAVSKKEDKKSNG